MESLISIIMPCKNAASFLKECLDSVIAQGWSDWELIIIDDSSTDDSLKILNEYAISDNRISVHKNKGNGIIPALEMAYSLAKGEWIHRMDADDIMPPSKLECLFFLLDQRKDAVATGKVQYFSDTAISEGYQRYQNWLNGLTTHQEMSKNRYRECVVASPNWLIHRSCFESHIKIKELNYPEDFDMTLKWFKFGYEILKTDEITHLWREHASRTSRTSMDYQQAAFFRMKVDHWVDDKFDSNAKLFVIGNNQKSILTTRFLKERGVPFENIKFEGNELVLDVSHNQKYILCNWPVKKDTQKEILDFLDANGLKFGENIWLF